MKLANRILQVLALLGAIAAGLFYFQDKHEFQSLDTDIQTLNLSLRNERSKTQELQKQGKEQAENLQSQSSQLEKLAADLLLANNQLLQLQRENKRLADERDAQEITERRLQKENGRLTQELSVIQATSVSQDEVASYEVTIANLERQILELKQTQAPQRITSSLPVNVPTNPSLRGNVLKVGKGASFVVLDIGYAHGVRLRNELYVQHADTAIAKIQVTEVKENLSIARVVPESLIKTPQMGDSVSSLN